MQPLQKLASSSFLIEPVDRTESPNQSGSPEAAPPAAYLVLIYLLAAYSTTMNMVADTLARELHTEPDQTSYNTPPIHRYLRNTEEPRTRDFSDAINHQNLYLTTSRLVPRHILHYW